MDWARRRCYCTLTVPHVAFPNLSCCFLAQVLAFVSIDVRWSPSLSLVQPV